MNTKIASALLVAVIFNSSALAQSPALTFDSLQKTNVESNWNLGFQFIANDNVAISHLGSLTEGIDADGVQVGLWDSNHNLLSSTTVTLTSLTVNQFSYTAISPISLVQGNNYFIASVGYSFYGWEPSNLATHPSIGYVKDAWNYNSSSLSFPGYSENQGVLRYGGFFGANFLVSAVPEPESYSMLLCGMGLLGFLARRKKRLLL